MQGRAHDGTGSVCGHGWRLFEGHTASDPDGPLRHRGTNGPNPFEIGGRTGCASRHDQNIGPPTPSRLSRHLSDVGCARRHTMLDEHIGSDRHPWLPVLCIVESKFSPVPQNAVCISLNQPLIGPGGTHMHVDANEVRTARKSRGQSASRIVAQHVHAHHDAPPKARAQSVSQHSQHGRYVGIDRASSERRISEVLDDEPICASSHERIRVGQRPFKDRCSSGGSSWSPRQWREVENTEKREGIMRHAHAYP